MAVERTDQAHSDPKAPGTAAEVPAQPASRPARNPVKPARRVSWRRWVLASALLLVIGAAVGAYWFFIRPRGTPGAAQNTLAGDADEEATPRVEVIRPRAGGLPRLSTQPGTLHAFESADLFAKVSGYLKELNVDIGDRVARGDVLAVIDDPEAFKAVEQATAALDQAEAQVKQAEAQIATAQADVKAAEAAVAKAQADVAEFTAQRTYRKSELDRITALARQNSVERKLVDEERERYASALASETAAQAAVRTNQALVAAARARAQKAEADLVEAKANVEVARTSLETAQVLADYTSIVSPYDGVITDRRFFRGDFIRSAAEGNTTPLLSVSRTDKLRVYVGVPDRDVPFVDRGDPAVVRVDALPGEEFKAVVSRFAESEDPADRTMHTEIDLENPDDRLREGMYGNVTIVLDPAEANALTIPSNSLIEQAGDGHGAVYVVRDGKVRRQGVRVGKDNGVDVEVLAGLQSTDQVVVRYTGSIADGLAVHAEPAARPDAGNSDHSGAPEAEKTSVAAIERRS